MRYVLSIINIFTLSIICCFAQEMSVTSFDEAVYDLSAATASRLDLNGKACALVKVQAPVEGLLFEGNIVGDIDFKGGEYWVYLTENSTELTIKHNNYYPCSVKITDFDIHSVQSQRTYILKINIPKEVSQIFSSISLYNQYAKTLNVIGAVPMESSNEYFIIKSNNHKRGICDIHGKTIIPAIFDFIYSVDKDIFWVQNNGIWHVINNKGEKIFDCDDAYKCSWRLAQEDEYEDSPGMIVSNKQNQFGVIDRRTGDEFLPMKYDCVTNFGKIYIGFAKGAKEVYTYNADNKQFIKTPLPGYIVDYIGYGKFKIAKKKKKYSYSKYGLWDFSGKIVLPMIYESIIANPCSESVIIEEHKKYDKLGWVRLGHLFNLKYETMLVKDNTSEFHYSKPPIFWERGWACNIGTDLIIYNPNSGDIVKFNPKSFDEAIIELGDFNDYNNSGLSDNSQSNTENSDSYNIVHLSTNSIPSVIQRKSDGRIGFLDNEMNIMYGE